MRFIEFYCKDVSYILNRKEEKIRWLEKVATEEGQEIEELNYIFCSDEYLLEMNKTHLNHDYYTDIITFDNSFEGNNIMGDVYMSIDRIKENAEEYKVDFDHELNRVLVHGLLHLLGYNDKTEKQQNEMTLKENAYLLLI